LTCGREETLRGTDRALRAWGRFRLPKPTWLSIGRFRPAWWTSCMLPARSTPTTIAQSECRIFASRPDGEVRGATLRDTKHRSAFRPPLGSKLTAWFAISNLAKAKRVVAGSLLSTLSYYSFFWLPDDSLAVVSYAGRSCLKHSHLRLPTIRRCSRQRTRQ
jgi:hypothetical protein